MPNETEVFIYDLDSPFGEVIEAMNDLAEMVCVAKCVNCHRIRETRPRWPEERERKILCADCRTVYIYNERN